MTDFTAKNVIGTVKDGVFTLKWVDGRWSSHNMFLRQTSFSHHHTGYLAEVLNKLIVSNKSTYVESPRRDNGYKYCAENHYHKFSLWYCNYEGDEFSIRLPAEFMADTLDQLRNPQIVKYPEDKVLVQPGELMTDFMENKENLRDKLAEQGLKVVPVEENILDMLTVQDIINDIEELRNDAACHLKVMKDYLHSALKREDWHGVEDAGSDIRDLTAKIEAFDQSLSIIRYANGHNAVEASACA